MTLVYTAVLGLALFVIVGALFITYIERRRGAPLLPVVERSLDTQANRVYGVGERIADGIERLPMLTLQLGYYLVHVFAVLVALVSRSAERRAKQLADMMSHKRSFERGETKSNFLKEVRQHKDSLTFSDDEAGEK